MKGYALLIEGMVAKRQNKCLICNVSNWAIFQKIYSNIYQCRYESLRVASSLGKVHKTSRVM